MENEPSKYLPTKSAAEPSAVNSAPLTPGETQSTNPPSVARDTQPAASVYPKDVYELLIQKGLSPLAAARFAAGYAEGNFPDLVRVYEQTLGTQPTKEDESVLDALKHASELIEQRRSSTSIPQGTPEPSASSPTILDELGDSVEVQRRFDQVGRHRGIRTDDVRALAVLEAARDADPTDPRFQSGGIYEALRQRLALLQEENTIRLPGGIVISPEQNPLNQWRMRGDVRRDQVVTEHSRAAQEEKDLRDGLGRILGEGAGVQAENEAIKKEILRIRSEKGISHRDLLLISILTAMFEHSAAKLDETYGIHDELFKVLQDKVKKYGGISGVVARVGDLLTNKCLF